MSRSYRKNPCVKICGNTDRLSKRSANKTFRRFLKDRLRKGDDSTKYTIRDVSDVWNFNSDGLAYRVDLSRWEKNEIYRVLRK